jgi:hypothetical protein
MGLEDTRKFLLDKIQNRAFIDDINADKLIELYTKMNPNNNQQEPNIILEEIRWLPDDKFILLMKKYNSQSYSSNTSQHTKAVAPAAALAAPPAAVLKTALQNLIKKYTANCIIDIENFTTEIINLITPPTNLSKRGKAKPASKVPKPFQGGKSKVNPPKKPSKGGKSAKK